MSGFAISQVRVRYVETDQMGVAHHSNYLAWFEVARTDLFRQLGIPYPEVERAGYYLPVLEAQCRYLQAAHYDDALLVKARLAEIKGLRIRLEYEIFREGEEKPLAAGSTTHTFINRDGKPVNLKKENPILWTKITRAD
ncbi:MAG: acyl-CoA thioesterase [Firmicutes bacterium]|nr:acyl-CoA thioesterase [Bacillota bacterium]MCL5040480.1 acyl-CoA thioesterase [Bacillota bacterium]